jgi:hypothetical protein
MMRKNGQPASIKKAGESFVANWLILPGIAFSFWGVGLILSRIMK